MSGSWDPFDQLNRISQRLEEIAEDMESEMEDELDISGMSGKSEIKVDIIDEEEDLVVIADLPGFEKNKIELGCKDDELTIKAEHTEETGEKNKEYIRQERKHKSVERVLSLPKEVEPEDAEASYENGVLKVRLPKTKAEEGTEIEVE